MTDGSLVNEVNGSMSEGYVEQSNEFNYKPVPPMAPVSLVLGLLSSIALLSYIGIAIGVFGIVLSAVCWTRIRNSQGELGGKILPAIGLILSVLFVTGGLSLHSYAYATEVPVGFTRINFYHDISKKGFVVEDGKQDFDPGVKELEDKKIFIKGFMYPTRDTEDLNSFLLVKDSDECCFGGEPDLSDMILVEMKEGMTVDFHDGMVAISGIFKLKNIHSGGELKPVYQINGEFFSHSRTLF